MKLCDGKLIACDYISRTGPCVDVLHDSYIEILVVLWLTLVVPQVQRRPIHRFANESKGF